MLRIEPTADASFAAIRERSKFGIAIAAMIKMIATTMSSSIREKPFCFFIVPLLASAGSGAARAPIREQCGYRIKVDNSLIACNYLQIDKSGERLFTREEI